MKKVFLLLFVLTASYFHAQNKQITIDAIWNGEFRPKYLYGLKAMPKSDKYSKIEINNEKKYFEIGIYEYSTLQKISTAFSTKNFPFIGYFEYTFSNDENKIIIGDKLKQIYRHSKKGIYYVYDRISKKLTKIDDNPIQEPSFSPDNNKVAFIKDNNIFYKNLNSGEIFQITNDGQKNKIINGIPDWVYEEEFGYSKAYEWNKNGQKIAFVKFDESEVPEFSIIRYDENLYPKVETFKYPKAGEKNSKVSLHYYNLKNKQTEQINLGQYEYIPRIKWANADCLTAITLNRLQNHIKLYKYNTRFKKGGFVIDRKSDTYIDLGVIDNLTFLSGGNFIWSNEVDGWNHLYLYNRKGDLIKQITKGNWEITNFYGYDKNLDKLFYQSTETGSINRGIYSIDLQGKHKKLLTPETGTSSAEFSANHKYFINTYSSSKTPYKFTVKLSETGKTIKTIIDNKKLTEKLKAYKIPKKIYTQIEGADGTMLNAYFIKPVKKKKSAKAPVLIYQYSGPNVQTVRNTWYSSNDYYHFLLAQQGYMIISVDPRGTGGRGAKFKKTTYNNLGNKELEDITFIAKKLTDKFNIDKNRIGIWGWSFGGFMASNAILQKPDVFKTAIAVAPVTNWRFYDSIYTERYLQTPQENNDGYDDNSPLSYAKNLKGNLLLIHGSGDDNVHVQNSMRLAKLLQENDKKFDEMIYTDKNHGIYGGKTRNHLYKKMLKYIKENL